MGCTHYPLIESEIRQFYKSTNQNVFVVKDPPIPVGGTLEVLTGSKVVLQTTDVVKIDCSVSAKIDAALSIMEIT